MNEFELVVMLCGLEALEQRMGSAVVDAALVDLAPMVEELTTRVLRLAHRAGAVTALRRGCWSASFALELGLEHEGDGNDDALEERLESMTAAARELATALALRLFGVASAPLAALTTACVPRGAMADLDGEMRAAAKMALNAGLRAAVEEIIECDQLRTVLQPIVALPEGRVVGVEALSRGPAGSAYERADQLFGAAARSGLTTALEMACTVQAFTYREQLPQPLWMSVNSSAATLAGVYGLIPAQGAACSRLIVELTEHLPLGKIEELRPMLDGLRSSGARIALDDTGCGYADLDVAAEISAEIVKLCITVISRVDRVEVRAAVAETVRQAHAQGALVLAEGVETREQAEILCELGVDLAQGWLYGRPFPAEELGAWALGGMDVKADVAA